MYVMCVSQPASFENNMLGKGPAGHFSKTGVSEVYFRWRTAMQFRAHSNGPLGLK